MLPAILLAIIGPAAAAQPDEYLRLSARTDRDAVAPGSPAVIAVTFEFAEGHHAWPNQPEVPEALKDAFTPIPTEIKVNAVLPAGVRVLTDRIAWPAIHEEDFFGSRVKFYTGSEAAFVPVEIGAGVAAGVISIPITVSYQVCNDSQCYMPEETTLTAELRIDSAGSAALGTDGVFADYVPVIDAQPGSGAGKPAIGSAASESAIGKIAAAVFFAALGGFLLNLTPCVLPVIPLKVMALTKHAETPAKTMLLTLWMASGVVAFWAAASTPLMLFNVDPSRIFGVWWVTLGLGALILIMAIGLFGVFQITLPTAVYKVNPRLDSTWGSFIFGVMTAVLGLPCFGFVVGALIPLLAGQPRIFVLIVFIAIGVGMAVPYVVLAMFPKLMSKMPKAGPTGELVKQVMALLLVAASMFFIGTGVSALLKSDPVKAALLPVWVKSWHWWAIALGASAAGVWLTLRTFQISKKPVPRVVFAIVGAILSIPAILFAINRTDEIINDYWEPYSDELFAEARAQGKIVVIDFTADWCLICQSLKAGVLDPDPVGSMLKGDDVVPLIADLTSKSAPGWKKLEDLGRTGIPTLAIFRPGEDQPWLANTYTQRMVLDAMGKTALDATPGIAETIPTSTESGGG